LPHQRHKTLKQHYSGSAITEPFRCQSRQEIFSTAELKLYGHCFFAVTVGPRTPSSLICSEQPATTPLVNSLSRKLRCDNSRYVAVVQNRSSESCRKPIWGFFSKESCSSHRSRPVQNLRNPCIHANDVLKVLGPVEYRLGEDIQ
jgi:hypothetical protein